LSIFILEKNPLFVKIITEIVIDQACVFLVMEQDRLKIVVFGAFGAGKTTLIKTLDPASRHIEAPCTGGSTTIALDFGRVDFGDRKVYLYGTPGQERFEFAREIIGRGMDGAILLIDATSPFDEFIAHLRDSLSESGIPFIAVLNKCEDVGAQPDALKPGIRAARIVKASAKVEPECRAMLGDFIATLPAGRHIQKDIPHPAHE